MTKLDLASREVTLVCATDPDVEDSLVAINHCLKQASFAEVKLFTSKTIEVSESIELIKIPALKSIRDYNDFILFNLDDYINTKYHLIVQYDGFITNTENWTDEFLEYDYLGALTWSSNQVGNGGFSLRSKKVSRLTKLNVAVYNGLVDFEDFMICVRHRHFFEKEGVRFCPTTLAQRFSANEAPFPTPYDKFFGIHSKRGWRNFIKK